MRSKSEGTAKPAAGAGPHCAILSFPGLASDIIFAGVAVLSRPFMTALGERERDKKICGAFLSLSPSFFQCPISDWHSGRLRIADPDN